MTSARLFIHRFRRPLSAASAALAVLLVVATLRPSSPQPVDVVVAATDLPAGATLTEDDLDVRQVPTEYVPPGAMPDVGTADGRTITSDVAAGEVITRSRLVQAEARSDGLHTVPVRLADAEAADLLIPGTLVDLVLVAGDGTSGNGGRLVAEGVRIVTIPRTTNGAGLGSTQRRAGSLIVVATDRRTAVTLAAVGTQPGLGVVMR
jgi:pilus assembly protein CpaB